MGRNPNRPQLRWRDYRSPAGRSPFREFMAKLSDADYAAILVAMNEVRREGLAAARHIEGDLYEIRRSGQKAHYRVIFALEGRRILLALDVYDKDTQKMPLEIKRRCEQRLRDWRARSSE